MFIGGSNKKSIPEAFHNSTPLSRRLFLDMPLRLATPRLSSPFGRSSAPRQGPLLLKCRGFGWDPSGVLKSHERSCGPDLNKTQPVSPVPRIVRFQTQRISAAVLKQTASASATRGSAACGVGDYTLV